MFLVERNISLYEQFILKDTEAGTSAVVTPERGGMLTGLSKDGKEYIYINEENFNSAERPRCAMPVLFPACGKTENDTYQVSGKPYEMPGHGIAHISKWQKIGESTDGSAAVTIMLKPDAFIKERYPFDFEIRYTYSLKGSLLSVKQEYINHGDMVMPFSIGFHPYFRISDIHNLSFDINAANIIPPQTRKLEPYRGDVHFPYGTNDSVILTNAQGYAGFTDKADGRNIKVKYDSNFSNIVLWSMKQDAFICVEPWTALTNSLNNGSAYKLEPGDRFKAEIAIEFN